MIDRLKQFREPAAVVALLVVLTKVVFTVVRMVMESRTTALTTVMRGTTGLFDLVDALVLTALVLACVMVAPVTRHARTLTLVSAVLMAFGVVTGLVLLGGALLDPAGWFSRLLESIGGVADIVFKGLFGWLLWNAYRAVKDAGVAPEETAALPASTGPELAPVPADPTREPKWRPDEATGVVWRRAGDAATGAAATAFGQASEGWTPAPVAELPAIRPGAPRLAPAPQDPASAAPGQSAPAPGTPPAQAQPDEPPRAVRVIVGEDDGTAARRSGPPSWDPADDVSRPARGE